MTPVELNAAYAAFGKAVLDNCLDCGWIAYDAAWMQDTAAKLGLLVAVEVTEPCAEYCACADDGFPATCYRLAVADGPDSGGWRKVADELPPLDTPVLANWRGGTPSVACRWHTSDWTVGGNRSIPTHWMPLSAPPAGEAKP